MSDPDPAETLLEHAGGAEAIHRLEEIFYAKVLADPLLVRLFGAGRPEHVAHLTAFTAESLGGEDRFGSRCITPTPGPTSSCTRCASSPLDLVIDQTSGRRRAAATASALR